MRPWWILLLFVPLAGEPAHAQVPEVQLLAATIEPFDTLVRPVQAPIVTLLHARASCALAEPVVGVIFFYSVAEQPKWASVAVSPSTDTRIVEACDGGWVEADAQVIVTATDKAPGFLPAPIVVEVTAGTGPRAQRAQADTNVTASYLSIVNVAVATPQAVMAPGSTREIAIQVANFGNAETRITQRLTFAPNGLTVTDPPPLVLESPVARGTRTTGEFLFQVTAAPKSGFVNRMETLTFEVSSAYAGDERDKGESAAASFLIHVRSGVDENGMRNGIPLPGALALGALAIAGALAAARRRR